MQYLKFCIIFQAHVDVSVAAKGTIPFTVNAHGAVALTASIAQGDIVMKNIALAFALPFSWTVVWILGRAG